MELNPNIVERTLAYLQAKLSDPQSAIADADTREKAVAGKIIYVEDSIYFNAVLVAGQTDRIELTDDRVDAEIGLTNLDKGKLPKFGYAAFTNVKLAWSAGTIPLTEAALLLARKDRNYNECLYDYAGALRVPTEILNGFFEIENGDGKVIFKRKVKELFMNGRELHANVDGNAQLLIPRIVKAEEKMKFFLNLPKGLTISGTPGAIGTGTRHYLNIEIPTVQTQVTA